ncbi:FAD-dependent oxidoreductase [Actinopolyspora mortivallis]|uniref:FAD-dependent oxidoreductase n=1 Tax=Actinopolyspora mortivallis TaxID=33906 RepID=UPI00037F76F6|nr:FAD-dependent oxidoreductase [Actinopolyspora mortivallis]
MRVGIIGGGISGLTAAWLLDDSIGAGVDGVTLFERGHRLGGHAESVPTGDGFADLGAQHLAPKAFPTHTRLLRWLGLDEETIPSPLSVTVLSGRKPLLVTPHPELRPQPEGEEANASLRHLGTFLSRAAELENDPNAWRLPTEDVVEPLDVPDPFKQEVLYPLMASFVGCSLEQTRGLSLRAAVAFLVRNAPADPTQPPPWTNLRSGVERLATTLSGQLRNTRLRTGTEVIRVRPLEHGHEIVEGSGDTHRVDHVVFATPPWRVPDMLDERADSETTRILRRFRFVRAVVGLHRDPTYLSSARECRSTNTVTVSEPHEGARWAETSTWYRPITGDELFKSWITHQRRQPTELVAAREYHHPVPTVDHIAAQSELERVQGRSGKHFAGSWTVDVDSQESAVRSACLAVRRILPSAPRLTVLGEPARQ